MLAKNGNRHHNRLPSFSFFEAREGENVIYFNGLPKRQSSKSRDGRNPQREQHSSLFPSRTGWSVVPR